MLTVRTAFILIAAALIGIAAGLLTYLSPAGPAKSVLAGGAAFGAAIALLNALIT